MHRRSFLKATAGGALCASHLHAWSAPPNIIVILADDLGYGDLGCYGSDIPTPNLDRMAAEGTRFDPFYVASPVCSPSRAALLTGKYPVRAGVPRVLMPSDPGLPASETTMGDMLRGRGYRTMCIGKWHLGAKPEFMPLQRGFDSFFGVPYSNDMRPLPLYQDTTVVEEPARLDVLTRRYTDAAIQFIQKPAGSPFFLYMAHTFPHIPLAVSSRFKGRTGLGLYGDCVAELDWSVGSVLNALRYTGQDRNTLVVFTSDNGPWFQGSPGRLRGRKGETWDGGMREPFIARWPGNIPAGRTVRSMATTMDLMPSFAAFAGASLPAGIDGIDIGPVLTGDGAAVDRPPFFYFDGWNMQCARSGKWKLHVSRYNSTAWGPDPPGGRFNLPIKPELYDLEADPQESYDVAADHPDIVAGIRSKMESALPSFPSQVQNAWRDTMQRATEGTPTGALPERLP